MPRSLPAWRRIAQVLFLLLFVALLVQARYAGGADAPAAARLFVESSAVNALAAALASRSFATVSIAAVVLLVAAMLLGRAFCGWACPLGTLLDGVRRLAVRKPRLRADDPRLRRWAAFRYVMLAAIAVAAALGTNLSGYVDPLSLLTRAFASAVFPLAARVGGLAVWGLSQPGNGTLDAWSDALNAGLLPALGARRAAQAAAVAATLALILALEGLAPRLWCRVACPLGALYGLLARVRLVRRRVRDSCDECRACVFRCRSGALIDGTGRATNAADCMTCGLCTTVCPGGSVAFVPALPAAVPEPHAVRLTRRDALGAALGGGAAAALASVGYADASTATLRPPGCADESRFASRCVRCGECVRICSTSGGGLQLAGLEHGWTGLWTPVFRFRGGCCSHECNLCGQVCPTEAIPRLPLPEKQRAVIGVAAFDRSRCIPWRGTDECIVCEEVCPTPDKAIKLREEEVTADDGTRVRLRRPYVDESLCIGCGVCETKCPVAGAAAVRVGSAVRP